MGALYKITFLENGKSYIGITSLRVTDRLEKHTAPSNNMLVGRAFKKYGKDNILVEVLAESSDFSELQRMEIAAIASHKTKRPNGYNLTDGGEGVLGYRPTEETRRKMSERTTTLMRDQARRERIAEKLRQHYAKPGIKEKHAARLRGKKQSAEAKEKISIALKGRVTSADTKRKIGDAHKLRSPKVEKECAHCGSNFLIKPSHASRSKFCSAKCANECRMLRTALACAKCGKEMTVKRSKIKVKNYCSIICSLSDRVISDATRCKLSVAKSRSVRKECKHCGKAYRTKPSKAATSKFCSHTCYAKALKKHVARKCARCGIDISVRGNNVREKNYCSKSCSMSMRRAVDGTGRITKTCHEDNQL